MGFKHTGIFPEQAVNWDFIDRKVRERKGKLNVLNLFAYTGGATLAAAAAGAQSVPCGRFKRDAPRWPRITRRCRD